MKIMQEAGRHYAGIRHPDKMPPMLQCHKTFLCAVQQKSVDSIFWLRYCALHQMLQSNKT
jgi:hypothetical protein